MCRFINTDRKNAYRSVSAALIEQTANAKMKSKENLCEDHSPRRSQE